MRRLRSETAMAARALEWTIFGATRVNEALRVLPQEIVDAEKTWTAPKARMKGRRGRTRAHRVPPSDRALEIFRTLPKMVDNPYLFQGQGEAGHITDGALRLPLSRMSVVNGTTHGFRETFKTWTNECTKFLRQNIAFQANIADASSLRINAARTW